MSDKKRIYFENLDGLRFLCFLSVFFFHSFHTEFDEIKNSSTHQFITKDLFGNGNIGVNFFFVLSGFLITYLLIQEKKLRGQINIRKFWMRRILRIWPLFFFCVAFGFLIFPQIKLFFGQVPEETANPLYYLTFTNNFDMIQHGLPDSSVLAVLWSVAIEEQFYFVWPIILFFFPIRHYWIPFVAIISGSLIFRAFYDIPVIHEHHTLSCIGDIAIGSVGAWLIIQRDRFKSFIKTLPKWSIGLIYLLFLGIFFFRDEVLFSSYGIRIVERTLVALVILFIILEQNYADNSFFKMSSFKRITKLGVITYGLYCLHFIGILVATTLSKKLGVNTELWQVIVLDTTIALVLSIIISKISYRYFETPFLRLKNRFAYIVKSNSSNT